MNTIPPAAKERALAIGRWANAPENDIRTPLENAAFLCASYGEPKKILSISEPQKTLCGRRAQHIELKSEHCKTEVIFAKMLGAAILSPDGTSYCALTRENIPIGPDWKPTHSKHWGKTGSQEILGVWETDSLILDEDLCLWEKSKLTDAFEKTPAGKKEQLSQKAAALIWKGKRKAETLEEAQTHQTKVFCRYIRRLKSQEAGARAQMAWATCAAIRANLSNAFPNLGRIEDSVREALWDTQQEFPNLIVDQEGESKATLNSSGQIHINGPGECKHCYDYKGFKENRDAIFKESNKKPGKPTKKQKPTPAAPPTEEGITKETAPERMAFCMEVAPGLYASLIRGDTCGTSSHGAVSSTGYHSQPKAGKSPEETLRNAFKTLQAPEKQRRKTNFQELIDTFDKKALKIAGEKDTIALLGSEGITKETIYDIYHPLQAAADEMLTLEAIQKLQEAKFELDPEAATNKLADCCRLLANGFHCIASEADALKWQLCRKILKIGRHLRFKKEYNGRTASIKAACAAMPTWEEKAYKKPPCQTQWRVPMLSICWNGITKEKSLSDWNTNDPQNIPKLLDLEVPEVPEDPEEEPRKPEENQSQLEIQLSLF